MKTTPLRTILAAILLPMCLASAAATFPRLAKLEQALDLTAEQKVQFDAAVAATQHAIVVAAINGMHLKQQVQAEFAKTRPDLAALAQAHDANAQASIPLRHAAREEWLKLYALLSDDQVATVKTILQEKLDHLDALQQFVQRLLFGKAVGLPGS